MSDDSKIRAFAQGLIDEGNVVEDEVGKAGAHDERVRREVGTRLLALLDEGVRDKEQTS